MTEPQRLYLVQARSEFRVFRIFLDRKFRDEKSIHHCHALHYLQMATELLGKAYAWRDGPTKLTHDYLVHFLDCLKSRKQAQKQLGYQGQNASWKHVLRKSTQLAEEIEKLTPTKDLAGDGPNPEYPWPPNEPTYTPVEFEFPIWHELTDKAHGRQFLNLITALFDAAETYL